MPLKWAKRHLGRWIGTGDEPVSPEASASFRLMLDTLPVGTLRLEGGLWHFAYTDDFRRSGEIRPIAAFPDVNKSYTSRDLWPFFALRIPSLKQPAVETAVRREHLDPKDQAGMLMRFGKKTVFNPFELIAA